MEYDRLQLTMTAGDIWVVSLLDLFCDGPYSEHYKSRHIL
jgi:hypothetical protein